MTTTYEQQAIDFLNKHGISFNAVFIKHDYHFDGDKDKRDIYDVSFTRGRKSIHFTFGNSINNSGKYKSLTLYAENGFGAVFHEDPTKLEYTYKQGLDWVLNTDFKAPSAYDVIACIQKYAPGTLDEFCDEFGYDSDSKKHTKIYESVMEEWMKINNFFLVMK